ncbi:hypothetical protein Bbelb_113860 [Branchiostoma belcheri]|nr:hypothetical protein Bbelb_113860 [Branchiostoma belcheri]
MLAKEAKTNNKAFWSYVNSRRTTKSQVGQLRDAHGNIATTDKQKAEVLNEQYYKTFTHENRDNIPVFQRHQGSTLETIEVTEDLVYKQLKSLRTDKSPGNDGMHPRILRELAHVIVRPLTSIFQLSINNAELPDQWTEASITPIYKKGDKSDPANYRPVSLTSVPCKMMERLISDAIIDHIKKNDLSCVQQHGFTQGKSTVTNLLEALDVWTETLSHQVPVDVIFLDYAKAFDTVPHERLLRKLESHGIVGKLLQWIRTFLTRRTQQVVVNGKASSPKHVASGVPQGSVLGPLLFMIFVSDIPAELKNFVSLFADDTKVYAAAQECEENSHSECLQADLGKLQEWSERMQMRFHPDKCKVLHLGKNNPRHEYTMSKADGTLHRIECIEEEKDLGVLIDSKLSFSSHVQTQVNKANRVLGTIKHTFKYLDEDSFMLLYKSLVRPHLEYATAVWSPRTKRDRDLLERVQRRATKLVSSIAHLSYSERLAVLGLPTLYYRRQRTDVIQLFKITHGIDMVRINQCKLCNRMSLTRSSATNTRGHQYKYQVQLAKGQRSNFFYTRAIPAWNRLSASTVSRSTVNQFKARLAIEWKDHPDQFQYNFSY